MIDKTQNPAEIYLLPVFDGDHDHVWCDTPAPGEGMREEDATRYVREDIYLELQAQVEQLQEKIFELQCFDVDVIRCLKTMAFDHNHVDILSYQKLAKECMDRISAENKANEIKAQAGRDGFVECYFALRRAEYGDAFDLVKSADQYANQLRRQAKAGE